MYRDIIVPFTNSETERNAWRQGVDDALEYAGVPENGVAFVISVDDPEQFDQISSEVEYAAYYAPERTTYVSPDPALGIHTFHLQVRGSHVRRFLKTGTKADYPRSPGDKALDVLQEATSKTSSDTVAQALTTLRDLVRKSEKS
jgi:hypothetical protein